LEVYRSFKIFQEARTQSAKENHSAGKSCGHCRQIMMSLAEAHAIIQTVTLSGEFLPADNFESGFLPDAFSEREVFEQGRLSISNKISSLHVPYDLLKLPVKHDPHDGALQKILLALSPHIISKKFVTSPVTACILKCRDKGFAAGVLMQDIAFLSTDAIFAAIGNAITRFGHPNLHIDEMHLASLRLEPAVFSYAEIELLSRYVRNTSTTVYLYSRDGEKSNYSFMACKNAANV
jgi:hypothetical protein